MKNKLKTFIPLFFLLFIFSPNLSNAGLLDGLIKDLQKNLPTQGKTNKNQNSEDATGKPKKKEKPKKKVEDGKIDYSSSSIISFLCKEAPLPGLPTDPSPNPQLVADDFGKSIKETKKILVEHFAKKIGPIWADSLPYYEDAFDQTEAKLLFNAFIASKGKNIHVLSQLKKMSKMEDMSISYNQEYSDARFAYSLVLAHYRDFHEKDALAEELMDTADGESQSGAGYITAKRIYYGWDVKQDISKAAHLISEVHEKGKFKRASELWFKVALDPKYKHHKRYQSMQKQAAQMKAGFEREMKRKSNSALRRRINRLNNVRIDALKKLALAFGVAEELARILAGFSDLKNQANPSQQLVEKNTKIGDEAAKFMAKKIATSNSTLDPTGQKLVKEAFNMNRTVIASLGATLTQFMTNPGSSGSGTLISDMLALAPSLDEGVKASCQLNTSIEDYGKKKDITIDQGDITPDEEDEFKDES